MATRLTSPNRSRTDRISMVLTATIHCAPICLPMYGLIPVMHRACGEEGVTSEEDPGWYRGPISPDFKIDEVLPHLFDKSVEYINEKASAAKKGKPFFLYLPLPAPHTPIVPVPPFKDASGINPYADFVMQCDHHMGQLFSALKENGIDEEHPRCFHYRQWMFASRQLRRIERAWP